MTKKEIQKLEREASRLKKELADIERYREEAQGDRYEWDARMELADDMISLLRGPDRKYPEIDFNDWEEELEEYKSDCEIDKEDCELEIADIADDEDRFQDDLDEVNSKLKAAKAEYAKQNKRKAAAK